MGIVAGQPQHQAGDLLGIADPAHGLAGGEGPARGVIIAGVLQPLLQRRRIHRARADGVAADALGDEIGRDSNAKIYAPEAITPLAVALRGRYPRFLGSEYSDDEEEYIECDELD